MSLSHGKTVSSTFQEPVWCLGTQLETKGSWEFLESNSPLLFEAFNTDDKLLIGNWQGDVWQCNYSRIKTETFCSNLNTKKTGTF